jgi:beta-1,4-N-acetylglucosaminyltransferase
LQLHALRPAWEELSRTWVTFDRSDSRSLLAGERVVHAYGPTNRSALNLLRNILLAVRVVARLRPRVILTTGAGVAVPFAWVGRLSGAKVVYVESATRTESPSLSLRLARPATTLVYVQWPELQRALPDARYRGSVLDPS